MADGPPTTEHSDLGPTSVLDRLRSCGWTFDFAQAAWLLERCTGRTQVGFSGPAAEEAIRFRPHVSMGFPSTDVRRITEQHPESSDQPVYCLDQTFLGLYGVATPLPLYLAIDVLRSVEPDASALPDEDEAGEAARAQAAFGHAPVRDFLDILHHRMISLFYRSWTKYRYYTTFGMPRSDAITDYLLWLIGQGPASHQARLGVSPVRLIRYAGALTQHPRSSSTLEGALLDFWKEIPFRVTPLMGRWVTLGTSDMNVLGMMNSALGVDLTIGEQVYDLSGGFRIDLGPVDWETYAVFLPDGECFAQTRSLVQLYCADPLVFTIEVRLRAGQVPEMQLSSDEGGARLGYTSWVRTEEMPETSVTFDASAAPDVEPQAAVT